MFPALLFLFKLLFCAAAECGTLCFAFCFRIIAAAGNAYTVRFALPFCIILAVACIAGNLRRTVRLLILHRVIGCSAVSLSVRSAASIFAGSCLMAGNMDSRFAALIVRMISTRRNVTFQIRHRIKHLLIVTRPQFVEPGTKR